MAADEPQGQGDCFPTAYRVARELAEGEDCEVVIAHGRPIFQQEGHPHHGQRYWHAWVELTQHLQVPTPDGSTIPVTLTQAIDKSNGNDMEIPLVVFYKVGQLGAADVRRYSVEQAQVLMLRHGQYGPWEDD